MTISFHGPLFDGKVTDSIRKAAKGTQDFALKTLRAKTPVDTGRLRSEWQVSLEGKGLRITNAAPYATYVELGTSRMSGRHMVDQSLPAIASYFQRQLGRELGHQMAAKVIGDAQAPPVTRETLVSPAAKSPGGFKSPRTVRSKDFGKPRPGARR